MSMRIGVVTTSTNSSGAVVGVAWRGVASWSPPAGSKQAMSWIVPVRSSAHRIRTRIPVDTSSGA
jgi:hypothetical protein